MKIKNIRIKGSQSWILHRQWPALEISALTLSRTYCRNSMIPNPWCLRPLSRDSTTLVKMTLRSLLGGLLIARSALRRAPCLVSNAAYNTMKGIGSLQMETAKTRIAQMGHGSGSLNLNLLKTVTFSKRAMLYSVYATRNSDYEL